MVQQSSSAGISAEYKGLLASVSTLLEEGRRSAARSVNAALTATYWLVGKRIVEYDQAGQARATYGSEVLKRLSADLVGRFGRGFSERNLEQMRLFYLQLENRRRRLRFLVTRASAQFRRHRLRHRHLPSYMCLPSPSPGLITCVCSPFLMRMR